MPNRSSATFLVVCVACTDVDETIGTEHANGAEVTTADDSDDGDGETVTVADTTGSNADDADDTGPSTDEGETGSEDDGAQLDLDLAALLARQPVPVRPLDPPETIGEALFELGEALFFDPILSGKNDIACATCHHPSLGSADGISLSLGTGASGLGPDRPEGEHREYIARHAPMLVNVGDREIRRLFWDGRVELLDNGEMRTPAGEQLPDGLDDLLAAQALFPLLDRAEMRGLAGDTTQLGEINELAELPDEARPEIWAAVMARLGDIEGYRELFARAYPDHDFGDLSIAHAANAIAGYERRTFAFADTPWDHYLRGELSALSVAAKRGAISFYSEGLGHGNCGRCHQGALLSDQEFHDTGIPQLGPGQPVSAPFDLGRAAVTGDEADRFAFRTPSLRSFAAAPPFMHNGSLADEYAVVLHYHAPELTARNYDASQLHTDLTASVQRDIEHLRERAESLSPEIAIAVDSIELLDIFEFLRALHDPHFDALVDTRPEKVPSGLPVP